MTLLELYNTWTDEEKKEALRDMKMDRKVELLSAALAAGFSLSAARAAGLSLSAALAAGFSLSEALAAGFSATGDPVVDIKSDIQNKARKMGRDEAEFVVRQLNLGLMNGESYGSIDKCGCYLGSAAKRAGLSVDEFCERRGIEKNSRSLAEQWFINVRIGDTPENSHAAKMGVEWIGEVLKESADVAV